MESARRNYAFELKTKVALTALKGGLILAELAQQFDVDPTQITQWRTQLLKLAPRKPGC